MSAEAGEAVWACARPGVSNRIGRTKLKEISVRVCKSVDGEGHFETQPTRASALGGETETSRGLTPKRIQTATHLTGTTHITETSIQKY